MSIDTPSLIALLNDDYAFYVIDLNKAVNFLNDPKGADLIEEGGGIYYALLEAQYDFPECGVTKYELPDGFFKGDATEIAVFRNAGLEVPDWLYD